MPDAFLAQAFAHNAWATARLLDSCEALSSEQLEAPVPGTYGSVVATLRHLIGSEAFYLFVVENDAPFPAETEKMSPRQLREVAEATAAGWVKYLARDPDLESWRREVDDDDGFTRDATVALRMIQALHHANEHRTQVYTALTVLGIAPPRLDGWTYGLEVESSRESLPGEASEQGAVS